MKVRVKEGLYNHYGVCIHSGETFDTDANHAQTLTKAHPKKYELVEEKREVKNVNTGIQS